MSTVTTALTSGGVGFVLATFVRARFEREHEWRRLLGDAAAELSSKLAGAGNAVRYAMELAEHSPASKKSDEVAEDAKDLANEAAVGLTRIRLLFFRTRPAQAAATTGSKLNEAVEDANYLANEAAVPLARVRLLFFRTRPAQDAATAAFENLRDAAASLRDSGDPKNAHALYVESNAQLEKFSDEVSKWLRKTIWRPA